MMLTAKQLAMLRFICGFVDAHTRTPSVSQIREGMGYASKASVHCILDQLEARGAIGRAPGLFGRRRIVMFRVLPIPRAPDGAPLHAVRMLAR